MLPHALRTNFCCCCCCAAACLVASFMPHFLQRIRRDVVSSISDLSFLPLLSVVGRQRRREMLLLQQRRASLGLCAYLLPYAFFRAPLRQRRRPRTKSRSSVVAYFFLVFVELLCLFCLFMREEATDDPKSK
jgi:hypothetical protein